MALLSRLAEAYPSSPALALVHTIIREATAVTRGAPSIDFALAALEHTLQLPYGTGLTLFVIGRRPAGLAMPSNNTRASG